MPEGATVRNIHRCRAARECRTCGDFYGFVACLNTCHLASQPADHTVFLESREKALTQGVA